MSNKLDILKVKKAIEEKFGIRFSEKNTDFLGAYWEWTKQKKRIMISIGRYYTKADEIDDVFGGNPTGDYHIGCQIHNGYEGCGLT